MSRQPDGCAYAEPRVAGSGQVARDRARELRVLTDTGAAAVVQRICLGEVKGGALERAAVTTQCKLAELRDKKLCCLNQRSSYFANLRRHYGTVTATVVGVPNRVDRSRMATRTCSWVTAARQRQVGHGWPPQGKPTRKRFFRYAPSYIDAGLAWAIDRETYRNSHSRNVKKEPGLRIPPIFYKQRTH